MHWSSIDQKYFCSLIFQTILILDFVPPPPTHKQTVHFTCFSIIASTTMTILILAMLWIIWWDWISKKFGTFMLKTEIWLTQLRLWTRTTLEIDWLLICSFFSFPHYFQWWFASHTRRECSCLPTSFKSFRRCLAHRL